MTFIKLNQKNSLEEVLLTNKAKFPIPFNVNIMVVDNPIFKIKEIVIYFDVKDKIWTNTNLI